MVEIVLVCSSPVYNTTKKDGELEKSYEFKDLRINVTENSLNQFIIDLQKIQKEMNTLKCFTDLANKDF